MAMNTKTMRLPPRRVLTPSGSTTTNNKRKEREEGFETPKPPSTTQLLKPDKPRTGLEPSSTNQLLGGYLAHEFLTRGTLFGQPWDPSRAEGPTPTPTVPEKKKGKLSLSLSEQGQADAPRKRAEQQPEKYERYVEVVGLLKADGTHLPGIVNPTQLARFLQL